MNAQVLRNLPRRLFLLVYAGVILVPLFIVVVTAFKTTEEVYASPFALPTAPGWENFATLFDGGRIGTSLLNSVLVTTVSVVATLFLASLAAYGVSRLRGWWGITVFGLFTLGLAVPAQVAMIPQYVLFRQLGLTDSLLGLVIVNIAVTIPIAVFIMAGFFKILPAETFEAAELDGAGPFRAYWSIALPLSTPSVAATAIFLTVIHWNDLLYPLLFVTDPAKSTLPKALLDFKGEYSTNYPVLFAGVILASAPLVIAYLLLQRHFVEGLTAGASK